MLRPYQFYLMQKRIEHIIANLELAPHPEGGYFKETYRSTGMIPQNVLEGDFSGDRNYSTGIYFLLTAGNFSAFHRIKQDEMWHFHEGDSLIVHMISPEGNYSNQKIGVDFEAGEVPQFVVPKGVWFASEVADGGEFSLVGCTVSPGFDFADFELADRKLLSDEFPTHSEIIERLTRD